MTNYKTHSRLLLILTLIVGCIFSLTTFVFASTTISTDIQTDGSIMIGTRLLQPNAAIKGAKFIFDGDSISTQAVVPTGKDWPSQLMGMSFASQAGSVASYYAIPGRTMAQIQTAYATGPHTVSPSLSGVPGYYFVLAGANDITGHTAASTMFTALQSLWSEAKADGYIVVAFTVMPRTTFWDDISEANRQALNSLIRAAANTGQYDYLVDTAYLLPNPFDTNFFQTDYIHPSVSGMSVIAQAVNTTLVNGSFYAPASLLDLPIAGNVRTTQTAMRSLTSGTGNTAHGYGSLNTITTGTNNTAVGYKSLASILSGSYDTAIGYNALSLDTAGYNTATGFESLFINSSGSLNTANGYATLQANTTGGSNTAIGYVSLLNNNTGSNNTGVGTSALQSNTTGHENTAVGMSALFSNSTGQSNTAVGKSTLTNATGINNTGTGDHAGAAVTSGAGNSLFGYYANVNSGTAQYRTVVGSLATGKQDNSITLGRPTDSIIFGTVKPDDANLDNGQCTIYLASDTSARVRCKGSDGIAREAILTLTP